MTLIKEQSARAEVSINGAFYRPYNYCQCGRKAIVEQYLLKEIIINKNKS